MSTATRARQPSTSGTTSLPKRMASSGRRVASSVARVLRSRSPAKAGGTVTATTSPGSRTETSSEMTPSLIQPAPVWSGSHTAQKESITTITTS